MTEVRLITANLIDEIKTLTEPAENLYWIVAFAMESGVRLVLPHLKRASENGAEIKILVGDYLHITQPQALDLLVTELPNAEIVYQWTKETCLCRLHQFFERKGR